MTECEGCGSRIGMREQLRSGYRQKKLGHKELRNLCLNCVKWDAKYVVMNLVGLKESIVKDMAIGKLMIKNILKIKLKLGLIRNESRNC